MEILFFSVVFSVSILYSGLSTRELIDSVSAEYQKYTKEIHKHCTSINKNSLWSFNFKFNTRFYVIQIMILNEFKSETTFRVGKRTGVLDDTPESLCRP